MLINPFSIGIFGYMVWHYEHPNPPCTLSFCALRYGMEDNAAIDSLRRDHAPEPYKAPHTLVRKLAYVAVISAAMILAFTGFGVWSVVSHYLIRFAENSSVNISHALSSIERDSFFTAIPEGQRRVVAGIPPERLDQLDTRIRQFLKAFDIVKIKVYTRDKRIIYSTDREIIGESDLGNRRLSNALSGRNDAKLVRKDRVQDLANESKLDVDVVETYVPIYDDAGEVIGCFEVYMDVSNYRGEIWQIVSIALFVIAVISLVVYGIAFIFLHKIARKLRDAQNALERYAATDPLTGLHNRRHILVRARQELARLQRERAHKAHTGLSVTMLDLDHFKKINDSYGHLVGDEVLKETAQRIRATTRAYDLVGRLGGEEFVVVHPDADYTQARTIAGRIWEAIRAQPYVIDGNKIKVAASLGVATLDLTTETDLTPALQRADQALYNAKKAGRDRVV
jgi:diguanylate cyclase (GGDEF)-like protein